MDKNISHFQSMLDQYPIQFPILLISEPQEPYDYDNFGLNHYQNYQNQDNENFSLSSPNPFKTQSKPSKKCQSESEAQNYWRNEYQSGKISNFEEVQSSQTFFIQQSSSDMIYEQSSTESKGKQSDQHLYQRRKVGRPSKKKRRKSKIVKQIKTQLQSMQEFQTSEFKRQGTLKSIAEILFQIIQRYNNLTFGDVAMKLVDYLSNKQVQKGKKIEQKKVKNLKRRVYDGLNVFIAAGIAEKFDIKKIRIKEKVHKEIIKKRLNYMKSKQENSKLINDLKEQITGSQERVQQKRKALRQLTQRRENLKTFFTSQSSSHHFNNEQSIIKFPFISITTDSIMGCEIFQSFKDEKAWEKDNSFTCDTYRQDDFVQILFPNEQVFSGISVEGDVDFVQRIGQQCLRSCKSTSKSSK